MSDIEVVPKHDDSEIPESALLNVYVKAHESVIKDLQPDSNGWLTLPGGEQVVITLEISPDGWRSLARTLLKFPFEPEWRLENAKGPDGKGITAWAECMPGMAGPGVWMLEKSCMLRVQIAGN